MKRYFNIALLSTFLLFNTHTHTIISTIGSTLGRTAQRVGPTTWKAAKWSTAVGLPPGAVLLFEIIGEKKAHGEEADFTVKELAQELGLRTRYALLGCKSLMEDFAEGLGEINPDDITTSFEYQVPKPPCNNTTSSTNEDQENNDKTLLDEVNELLNQHETNNSD